MEQKQAKALQRPGSFNPEAPTFSPTAAETSMSTGPAGPTPPTSPRRKPNMPDMFDHSPFRPTRDLRPNYQGYEEVNAVRMPSELPDQKEMPLDSLQEMLRDHHIALNQDRSNAGFRSGLARDSINNSVLYPPLNLLSTERLRSDSNTPGLDELSAGLGLPGIRRSGTNVDLPSRSHKSRDSETLSEGLFAQYLHGKSISTDDLANLPRGNKGYIQDMHFGERADEGCQSIKLVAPPPGFTGERPRKIFAEERSSVDSVAMNSPVQHVPAGPLAFGHPRYSSDLQSFNHAQHHGHSRGPSRHYRPCALTRSRRTDQGPEPSHADIYPDDASFMPHRPSYQPDATSVFQGYISDVPSARQFQTEAAVDWPTPAEVYRQKPGSPTRRSVFARNVPIMQNRAPEHWSPPPASSMSQYMQQFGQPSHPLALKFPPPVPSPSPPFSIFASHYTPTHADIHEPDAEMECLLAILPDIFDLNLPEMPSDERPLTPGQTDGTRYGMDLNGIGMGDRWNCPDVLEGEPFRVRPRNHDGWGGWQWAIDRGWGNE
ncbi:hypothetical protein G6011_04926 [Alternaria panax]|uniref:Uncharacterized protein n=1 Tax=Alternaria panax TaxID=48097 RepID=A0AAD4IHE2_9PLEO|nr:hypothetical protein G6011_04926 [Alternaria panax]